MRRYLTNLRLLIGVLAVSVVIVAAAISSGVVALRKAPRPDSPATIRSNVDTPELEREGARKNASRPGAH